MAWSARVAVGDRRRRLTSGVVQFARPPIGGPRGLSSAMEDSVLSHGRRRALHRGPRGRSSRPRSGRPRRFGVRDQEGVGLIAGASRLQPRPDQHQRSRQHRSWGPGRISPIGQACSFPEATAASRSWRPRGGPTARRSPGRRRGPPPPPGPIGAFRGSPPTRRGSPAPRAGPRCRRAVPPRSSGSQSVATAGPAIATGRERRLPGTGPVYHADERRLGRNHRRRRFILPVPSPASGGLRPTPLDNDPNFIAKAKRRKTKKSGMRSYLAPSALGGMGSAFR